VYKTRQAIHRRSFFSWLVPLLVAMPLLLAGCSDGSDGKDGAPGTPGAPGAPGANAPAAPTGDLSQGVKAQITGASIDAASTVPTVTFKLTHVSDGSAYTTFGDDLNAGKIGNGAAFTLAKLEPRMGGRPGHDWVNYVLRWRTARNDSQGTKALATALGFTGAIQAGDTHKVNKSGLMHLGNGEYRYTFVNFNLNNVTKTQAGSNISNQIECQGTGADKACWWIDGTPLPAGVSIDGDTFSVAYNPDVTHRIGIMLANNLINIENDASYAGANDAFDFVPSSGAAVATARDIVATDSCNSCHENLAMHLGSGNIRTDVRLCVSCHSTASFDSNSGRTIDFKQMVHKLHRGADLPSVKKGVPFFIRKSETGDWSAVRYPQLVSEAAGAFPSRVAGQGIDNCVKCHMGQGTRDALVELAGNDATVVNKMQLASVTADGDLWRQATVAACSSCHDDKMWPQDQPPTKNLPAQLATYYGVNGGADWRTNHSGGDLAPNTCSFCHGNSTDAIVAANLGKSAGAQNTLVSSAHLQLTRSVVRSDLLETQIDSVTLGTDVGGKTPLDVKLRVWDKAQNKALIHGTDATFALGLTVGWRAEGFADYTQSADTKWPGYVQGARMVAFTCNNSGLGGQPTKGDNVERNWNDCLTSTGNQIGIAGPDGNGYYTLTVQLTSSNIPAKATGTVGTHAGLKLTGATWGNATEAAAGLPPLNPPHAMKDFSIGGATIKARREVVSSDACRACHLRFGKHAQTGTGGNYWNPNRNNPQICVMCHNPNATDISRSTAASTRLGRGGSKGHFDGKIEEAIDFKRFVHGVHGKSYLWEGEHHEVREHPMQIRAVLFGGVTEGVGLTAGKGYFGSGLDPVSGKTFGNHRSVFPSRTSTCSNCHAGNSQRLPLAEGVIGSTIKSHADHNPVVWTPGAADAVYEAGFGTANGGMPNLENHTKYSPTMGVCSSCHDSTPAAAHMRTMGGAENLTLNLASPASTGGANEACATCHGPDRINDADAYHAR